MNNRDRIPSRWGVMRPTPSPLGAILMLAAALAVAAAACGGGNEDGAVGQEQGSPVQEAAEPPGTSTAGLDGDLRPGAYHTELFQPTFSFEVREPREGELGWRWDTPRKKVAEINEKYGLPQEQFTGDTRWSIVAEQAAAPYFEFIRRVDLEREATSWGISFIREVYDDSVETVVQELRSLEGLESGEPSPAALGGADGLRFDSVVTAEGELRAGVLGDGIFYAEGQQIRFVVVDVEGATKVITIEAPDEEFEEFLPEAEEFLATVRWWPSP